MCNFWKKFIIFKKGKSEGEVVPVLQLSTTPLRRIGECRYSPTLSLTSALDGGEWSEDH